MDTKTASTKMFSLVVLYDMHSGYYPKAIEGISEENALNRLNTKANNVAWLAGSMLYERFEMAKALGGTDIHPEDKLTVELFKNHKGIQDGVAYPSLSSYKKDWEAITPVLR